MAITRPCPKCQQPLAIPEPIPERLQCPHCATVMRFKVPAAAAPKEEAPKPEPPKSSPSVVVDPPPDAAKTSPDAPKPAPAKPKEPEPTAVAEGAPPAKKPTSDTSKAKVKPAAEESTGLVSYVHTLIPKPILFGLYGALGGFLGILLLGELIMRFHPAPQHVEPLLVEVSRDVTVYPGSRSSFNVRIKRQGWKGPVIISAPPESLPVEGGFQIPDMTIEPDEDSVEIPIGASPKAGVDTYEIKLKATTSASSTIAVETTITAYVQPLPASLGFTVSPIVTVYAGGKNQFGFKVARARFDGPVRAEVLDLPKGIHCDMITLNENQTDGMVTVRVDKEFGLDKDSKRKPYRDNVLMDVHSLDNHKIAFRRTFQLNVEPPPGNLQLAAPPQVTVFPGTKNRFSVKISRKDFENPIEIKVEGASRDIQFTSAVIGEKEIEAVIEVHASRDIRSGDLPRVQELRIRGTAIAGSDRLAPKEEITHTVPLRLNVVNPPPTVQLAVSPKVPVYAGGMARFGVKINRSRFSGPVQITGQPSMPGLVRINPVTIPADKNEAELTVLTTPAALNVLKLKDSISSSVSATFAVKGFTGGTSEKFDIELLAPPSDLNLAVSPEVEVYQGGRCRFNVKIARSGFSGPVNIAYNKVPPGVNLSPGIVVGNELGLMGSTGIDVEPKKYEIDVFATATRPAADGKIPATKSTFILNVKPYNPADRKLDIVFVLDITQSLDAQIAGLRDGIGQFVKGLKDRDLDEARIGLIGFRDFTVPNEVHFEWLKFDKGSLFTTDLKAFSREVGKLKATGGGDDPESSLDAIKKASEYPFRPDAKRILLLITDEKPQTKGNSLKMSGAQEALRAAKIDQVHLIINKKRDYVDYKGLHDVARGGLFDFHEASKGTKEGFAAILPHLSKEIAVTIGAPEPKSAPPVQPTSAELPKSPPPEQAQQPKAEASPTSPTPIVPQAPKAGEVPTVGADEPTPPLAQDVAPPKGAEAATIQGLQSTHKYADEDRTKLMLVVALWTAALAAGVSLTLAAAQKRYLSQAWIDPMEAGKALAAGLCAGLFAGVISQWFFFTVTTGTGWWDAISRVIGWVLLGALIGYAMGLFVPNMNSQRAAIGGAIGGFIGGLAFMLVEWLAASYLKQSIGDGAGFLARLVGATLLGLCIGILVAIAELASRRFWLEVSFTEREVRTVTLGADAVALGGDEKQVGVYIPNAAPKALGYRVERDRVFVDDFTTGRTEEVKPGEVQTLGKVKIKVCSADEATPTGAKLTLLVTRDVPLMIGVPMTAEDIPGLEAQGSDGVVAIVSRRPNNPNIFLLRNRSKQTWTVTDAEGKERKIDPGLSIELTSRCEIDFGQVKATLDPSQA
ncbi:MAG: VWA domain-containing protein [Planctomycetes bacterium]|nr:VWA domain-containing protein [Planctomycetota bacterium]